MHVHVRTYVRICINTCTGNAHKHTPHTNLIKVDIQSCPGGLHSIVQLPQPPQYVGEPHKPNITVDTRTHVDGTAVTLIGLTRVAHNTPVQTGQVEKDTCSTSLQGEMEEEEEGVRGRGEGMSWRGSM